VLAIRGVGEAYAHKILSWQKKTIFSSEVSYVGPMIVADAKRILELISQIASLERDIGELASASEMARLISTIPGFGEISAPELAGEIGTLARFEGEGSLALYLGMCPLTDQSGEYHGTKTPRQVNKRAKAAMMTATAHHIRQVPQSRAYYDKKRAEGKSHNQAVRALGRHMVRVIWCMLREGRHYEIH
jgi:transposase